MTFYELQVAPQEQTVNMLNGYSAQLLFDPFYKRWYYNLYLYNDLVAAGVALNPDTFPLIESQPDSLGLVDIGDPKVEYEPYAELGGRLKLVEVTI